MCRPTTLFALAPLVLTACFDREAETTADRTEAEVDPAVVADLVARLQQAESRISTLEADLQDARTRVDQQEESGSAT